jgi:hypothetical protein
MSFKDYNKKMRSFRPDLQYWEDVLTKEKEWEKVDTNEALVYTVDQIKEFQASDCIARSVYVLGNGGPTDVCTNQDTAYEIQEALQARYKNMEQWGLTTLAEKSYEVIRARTFGSTGCGTTRNS